MAYVCAEIDSELELREVQPFVRDRWHGSRERRGDDPIESAWLWSAASRPDASAIRLSVTTLFLGLLRLVLRVLHQDNEYANEDLHEVNEQLEC
jgi:hypothetical protein